MVAILIDLELRVFLLRYNQTLVFFIVGSTFWTLPGRFASLFAEQGPAFSLMGQNVGHH